MIRTLFHFTSLSHLDSIVETGLSRGDFAGTDRWDVVSLTKRPEPTLAFWGGSCDGIVDKLRVRITAMVEESPALMRWRDALRKHGVRSSLQKRLDPLNDGHNWFCYFGTIPPASLSYEVRNDGVYESVSGEALTALVASIKAEMEKWIVWHDGPWVSMKLAPGVRDSFLLDGTLRDEVLASHQIEERYRASCAAGMC